MFKSAKGFYYSLGSLGGLILVVIGLVILLQLGFSLVFKTQRNNMMSTPPDPASYVYLEDIKNQGLTASEKEALDRWKKDYETWRENDRNFDWEAAGRKDQASFSLSFLIIGLPVFLFHLAGLKREKGE